MLGGGTVKGPDAGWAEALASPTVRIGCILFLLQQFSGINAIVYFSSSVFQVLWGYSWGSAVVPNMYCNRTGSSD